MYQADPHAEPDEAFVAGELGLLVPGNRGRLLDARRTPVRITALDIAHGYFELEILAFEDRGAHWLVPLEEVSRYQFQPSSVRADVRAVGEMRAAIARLDVTVQIAVDGEARHDTQRRIGAERAVADQWLAGNGAPERLDVAPFIASRRGCEDAFAWLAGYLGICGLAGMDHDLATAYVRNPNSGDLVRAHLITAAQLGLCSYRGKQVRDPASLSESWSADRRAAHLVHRLAFVQALWRRANNPDLMLYRGMGLQSSAQLEDRRPAVISATFSREVADSHFTSQRAQAAALVRFRLPIERLFMTFLETAAMSTQYLEAEAIIFTADHGPWPGSGLF